MIDAIRPIPIRPWDHDSDAELVRLATVAEVEADRCEAVLHEGRQFDASGVAMPYWMRNRSIAAANHYDRLGFRFHWRAVAATDHGDTPLSVRAWAAAWKYWALAVRAYRRGKSHARANATTGRAQWARENAAKILVQG